MEHEAFVYLWYDAPNKKYYLGKHKGTPDDSYTHSSMSSDEFCSVVPHSLTPINERREFFENMPKGVSRRILAYGTHEEICVLEHELLVNRKKRCWNRYYNNGLGDPRYVDQSGENNPSWKDGRTLDMKAYRQTPQYREYHKKYKQTPEYKAYNREYMKAYKQMPEYKEHMKEYRQTPKHKEYQREYMKEYRLRKKSERQGVGTLDQFMG